jgi:hypothetical protein
VLFEVVMQRPTIQRPFEPAAQTDPARRAAAFVDELLRRARNLTPLVEFMRAHLDAAGPGAARSLPEHLVDLLALGLRWRAHARAALRRPTARPDHDSVAALLVRLRAVGRPAAEIARMGAWNDFALQECCPEALDEACDLAAWFELAADAALGRCAPGTETQLELVRAEVLSRSLRERRLAAAPVARLRLTPLSAVSASVPRPAVARANRLG